MPVNKLTSDFIADKLHCPPGKSRIEYCDTDIPGLYIEVRSTSPGQGTYYLRYKDATGKTCHQKIGRTSDMSLADARTATRRLKAEIRLGRDPRGEAKANKAVPTWDEFFNQHYLPYAKPRKRSWVRDEQLHRLRISGKFGRLRLNQITRQQIQLFHTGLLDEGLAPASADHHVKLLKHALNLAVDWEMIEKNPAARVPLLLVDNKIELYLSQEQLTCLVHVLQTDSARGACQILLFLLATGARLNEALQARWEQVDRKNRVWRILASNSKSKRMRSIPLNDSALDVLNEVGTEGKFDHVFINHRSTGDDGVVGQPYKAVHKVWERLREKAGLPHLRIHDLRHNSGSRIIPSAASSVLGRCCCCWTQA